MSDRSDRPFVKIPALETPAAFRRRLAELGLDLPCDDAVLSAPESPLARPLRCGPWRAGNRWCIQPMEGWDGTPDGRPSELTFRRWTRFGQSGAKLIWGGEAVAVTPEGRANPRQLLLRPEALGDFVRIREALIRAHRERFGSDEDLVVGLQLTHSGRFCRPEGPPAPRILFHHPILDRKFGLPPDYPVLTDGEVRAIVEAFVRAAALAEEAGFQFVDIKHCHGYLGHEFLAAHTRPGPYGGSFENRTRFLREVVAGIRAVAPRLTLAVRLSAFDLVPFRPAPAPADCPPRGQPARGTPWSGRGVPEPYADFLPYRYGFGVDPQDPCQPDLTETIRFLELLGELGIPMVNLTAGSPYYNPHIQRPALYPPSDGYAPPEDPLVGCARQVEVVRRLKRRFPGMTMVGSGYTYFQEYLPHVAQALVREGAVDAVGLGRMVLAYPELPADTLSGRGLQTRRICRTFSDCTTAPRGGLVSGCYPLDPAYRDSPLRQELLRIKHSRRAPEASPGGEGAR